MTTSRTPSRGARRARTLGLFGALALGLSVLPAQDAFADKKKPPAKNEPPPPAAEPPMAKKAISHGMKGIVWGQSSKTLIEQIEKVIDEEYRPIYAKTSPGVKMKELDAQVSTDKEAFKRSKVEFGKTPTGFDNGPLKPEYTYNNKEMVYVWKKDKKTVYFFFIQDKLWKIIEDRQFVKADPKAAPPPPPPPPPKAKDPKAKDAPPPEPPKPGPLTDFAAVAVALTSALGVPGRLQAADYSKGRYGQEVDWKDGSTHLRAIDRGTSYSFAYEDIATLGNLTALRPNKPTQDPDIDPAVAAALGKSEPTPPPPPPPKKKGK